MEKDFLINTIKVVDKIDFYKDRGIDIISSKKIDKWNSFIDQSLQYVGIDQVWYNGVVIEAALDCMELLSNNKNFSKVYSRIDPNGNNSYINMEIDQIQAILITEVISNFHPVGNQFLEFVNQPKKILKKTKDRSK